MLENDDSLVAPHELAREEEMHIAEEDSWTVMPTDATFLFLIPILPYHHRWYTSLLNKIKIFSILTCMDNYDTTESHTTGASACPI